MVRSSIVLGVVAMAAAGGRADGKADALKALQGEWRVVSMDYFGGPIPADRLPELTFTFKEDAVIPNGRAEAAMKVTLDPAASPARIDLADKATKPLLGIYEVSGDTLKLCLSDEGMPRPEAFNTLKVPKTSLFVLKRVKK